MVHSVLVQVDTIPKSADVIERDSGVTGVMGLQSAAFYDFVGTLKFTYLLSLKTLAAQVCMRCFYAFRSFFCIIKLARFDLTFSVHYQRR